MILKKKHIEVVAQKNIVANKLLDSSALFF
jgi:hypothetical protein